jgi:hypothetical protein
MSVFRSPARPSFPGNRKEGEVSRSQPHPAPLGPAKSGRQPGSDASWKDLHKGPEQHEDQRSMGKGRSDAHDEANIKHDHDPGWNKWEAPHGSKENHRTDFVPGQKHKK